MNSEFKFSLSITAKEYQRYYSGDAKSVKVRTLQGLLIQFPASNLKPFVTHNGIDGHFKIVTTEHNKIVAFEAIE